MKTEITFSLDSNIQDGWKILTTNWTSIFVVLGVSIMQYILVWSLSYLVSSMIGEQSVLRVLPAIISFIVNYAFTVFVFRLYRSLVDNTPRSMQQLFSFKAMVYLFLHHVSRGLLILVGYMCFFLPGIYLQIRTSLGDEFVLDKEYGPIQAIQASFNASKGYFWTLFGMYVVYWIINLVGLLLLGIGLFITVPLTTIANLLLYRFLAERTEAAIVTEP